MSIKEAKENNSIFSKIIIKTSGGLHLDCGVHLIILGKAKDCIAIKV